MSEPGGLALVDSSVWIPALRRGGVATLRHRVDVLLAENALATTGMIWLELLAGASSEASAIELGALLEGVHYLPTDRPAWEEAARIGRLLRRVGRPIPNTDLLIAATAMRAGAVLVHRDAHYETIAEHTPLRTESFLPRASSSAGPDSSGETMECLT